MGCGQVGQGVTVQMLPRLGDADPFLRDHRDQHNTTSLAPNMSDESELVPRVEVVSAEFLT